MRIEHCEHQSIRIWINLCLPAFKHLPAGERKSILKRRKEDLLIICDIIPHKNISDKLLGCLHSTMHEVNADTIDDVLFQPNLLLRIIGVGPNSFSTGMLCDVDPLFISWAILPEDADLNIRIAVCPSTRCRTAKEYSTHVRQSCICWSETLCKSKTPSARLRHSSSFILYHIVNKHPTACVREAPFRVPVALAWAGRDNAALLEAFKFLESAALLFPRTRPSRTLGDREEVFTHLSSGQARKTCITRGYRNHSFTSQFFANNAVAVRRSRGCGRRRTAARPPRVLTGERE